MKKNTLTILIILAVIALLHFVFIYFFFVRSAGSDKPENLVVPEPTIITPPYNPQQNDEPSTGSSKKKLRPKG